MYCDEFSYHIWCDYAFIGMNWRTTHRTALRRNRRIAHVFRQAPPMKSNDCRDHLSSSDDNYSFPPCRDHFLYRIWCVFLLIAFNWRRFLWRTWKREPSESQQILMTAAPIFTHLGLAPPSGEMFHILLCTFFDLLLGTYGIKMRCCECTREHGPLKL